MIQILQFSIHHEIQLEINQHKLIKSIKSKLIKSRIQVPRGTPYI